MAVYVKPRGLLGKGYVALVKPFRRWIIYPALMRQIERAWNTRIRSKRVRIDQLPVSGNDKSMSESVKTYDRTLGDPVSTTSCEHSRRDARGSHDRTTFRRPDHRRRPVRYRYRPARCRPRSRTRPSPCWSDASGWAAPGTCSATRESVRTPTCTPSVTSSARGRTLKVLADGPSIRAVHRRDRGGVRHRRQDPLRPESRHRGLVQPREPLDGDDPARGERRNAHLHAAITSSAAPATTTTTRATCRPSPAWTSSRVGAFTPSTGRRTWTTPARRSS